MKKIITYLFSALFIGIITAQNPIKNEQHPVNVVIRLDRTAQNGWNKIENENQPTGNTQVTDDEDVSFNSTSDGIYISILKGTNKIKLFALTGQLLLNGDLSQGRFFIPTRKGIYFLKINNNSYKVICK
ncbi:MAG TPA: T9SS type A sorting domain-containing protein [Paludibacter sp.]|nr:T9SS type A sorting domain-containing protein [Paludibacter sp.]